MPPPGQGAVASRSHVRPTHPPSQPSSCMAGGRAWLPDVARCLLVKWVPDPKTCLSGFNPERVPVDFSGFIDVHEALE